MIDRLMGSEGEREMEMGQLRSRMGCKLDFPFIDSSISRFVSADIGNVSRIFLFILNTIPYLTTVKHLSKSSFKGVEI